MAEEVMICPDCGCEDVEDAEDGTYDCLNCGLYFDPSSPEVIRDQWLVAHGLHPSTPAGIMPEEERDHLRRILCDRQRVSDVELCVVCRRGMYGDSEIHEAIVKRGDLPSDPRIFAEVNCVVLHHKCHENTAAIDAVCAAYLISHYGISLVVEYLEWLGMEVLPGRAREIVERFRRAR